MSLASGAGKAGRHCRPLPATEHRSRHLCRHSRGMMPYRSAVPAPLGSCSHSPMRGEKASAGDHRQELQTVAVRLQTKARLDHAPKGKRLPALRNKASIHSYFCAHPCTPAALLGPALTRSNSNFSGQALTRSNRGLQRMASVPSTGSMFLGGALAQSFLPAGMQALGVLPPGRGETAQLPSEDVKPWSVDDSVELYGVDRWGAPYFSINESGHVAVHPLGTAEVGVDLVEVAQELKDKFGLQPPFIARFPEIIGHRIQLLQDCFNSAIERFSYTGSFKGVFPVKTNRDWAVVQAVVESGAHVHFGLEAGSKPELLVAAAALTKGSPEALLICNGYKDKEYIETALLVRQLGIQSVIVLEQMEELELVVNASLALGVKPVLGVRAKLSTRVQGHWADTAGDRGKFGLTASELVQVIRRLKKGGMLDSLRLLHFHFGSQISDIAVVKEALREGSHIYTELALLGAPMAHIDVGGGLGIDYDGSKSATAASLNYSVQNYANDVVAAIVDACHLKGVPHPTITTESGRALASHQSVLVFCARNASHFSEAEAMRQLASLSLGDDVSGDASSEVDKSAHNRMVRTMSASMNDLTEGTEQQQEAGFGGMSLGASLGVSEKRASSLPDDMSSSLDASEGGNPKKYNPARRAVRSVGEYLLDTFQEVYSSMNASNFQESYNDAKQFKAEAASMFKLGCLSLSQRAHVDALFLAVCHRALRFAEDAPGARQSIDLSDLRTSLASVYHCNWSIFQSAPDTWAIQQLFPIMPLLRLSEEPNVEATLADLTCDSDGKVARFIGREGQPLPTLRLHKLKEGEPYLLGMFLGGVYQESLGNVHNLFGSVSVAYIRADVSNSGVGIPNGRPSASAAAVDKIIKGHSVEEVLHFSQINSHEVCQFLLDFAKEATEKGQLTSELRHRLPYFLAACFKSYTYLGDK